MATHSQEVSLLLKQDDIITPGSFSYSFAKTLLSELQKMDESKLFEPRSSGPIPSRRRLKPIAFTLCQYLSLQTRWNADWIRDEEEFVNPFDLDALIKHAEGFLAIFEKQNKVKKSHGINFGDIFRRR